MPTARRCQARAAATSSPGSFDQRTTRLGFDQLLGAVATAAALAYEEALTANQAQKRLIEHVRTQYRPNDLGAAQGDALALLPPGQLESLALPGESYKLAFTPGLIAKHFGDKVTDRHARRPKAATCTARATRTGGCAPGASSCRRAPMTIRRPNWRMRAGTSSCRIAFAIPFIAPDSKPKSVVAYDAHDLSIRETRDALDNVATAVHDYRVLQPRLMTDPNGNRAEVAFDALGMVVGTAVMGKDGEAKGDSLLGFTADLDEATVLAHLEDPLADPHAILQRASTRLVYDLFAYLRSRDQAQPQPAVVYALARETHDADLVDGEQTRIQHSFSYSDGFGREIQKKIQAEPGPLVPGGADVDPRWVGSGWTIFNNKGKPVRQYEPFFSATHRFEFARTEGVSPVLFYDPVGRVVATLHPNHTWEKVVFDPWRQESWDVNDTVLHRRPEGRSGRRRLLPPSARAGVSAELVRAARRRARWVRRSRPPRRRPPSMPTRRASPTWIRWAARSSPWRTTGSSAATLRCRSAHRGFHQHAGRLRHRGQPARGHRRAWTASSCATTTTCWATGCARPAWKPASAGCSTTWPASRSTAGTAATIGCAPATTCCDRPTETLSAGRRRAGAAGRQDRVRREPAGRGGEQPARQAVSSFRRRRRRHHRRIRLQGQPPEQQPAAGRRLQEHAGLVGDVALEAEVFTTRTSFDALNRPVTQTTPDNSIIRRPTTKPICSRPSTPTCAAKR